MLKLFVGLGNPGPEYAMNRHNVGFMAADRISERWRGTPWRAKFQSEIAEADVDGTRVLLVKPMTYMNLSGNAVAEVARFYKIPLADIIIAHDEIDLPPGKFKMKTGGGTGGHNGLKSISAHLKDGYRRLRIGVGHPGRKEMVPGYVLKDFAKADAEWLDPMLDAFAEEAGRLARGDDAGFASKVHLRLGGGTSTGAARRKARAAARADGAGDAPDAAQTADTTPKAAPRPAAPEAEQPAQPEPRGPFAALANLIRK